MLSKFEVAVVQNSSTSSTYAIEFGADIAQVPRWNPLELNAHTMNPSPAAIAFHL